MDMNSFYSMNKEKAKLAAAEEEFKQINTMLNREREHRSALRELLNDTEQRIERLNLDVKKTKAKIEKLRNKVEEEETARKLQEQKSHEEEKQVAEIKQEIQNKVNEIATTPKPKIGFLNALWASRENRNQSGVSEAELLRRANRPVIQPIEDIKVSIGENPDLETCEKLWNGAVQTLHNEKKMSLYCCAKGGRAFGMVDDTLVVIFKSAFQSERMNKYDFRQVMEELFYKVSDKHYKLQCYSEAEYKKMQATQYSDCNAVDIEENCLF